MALSCDDYKKIIDKVKKNTFECGAILRESNDFSLRERKMMLEEMESELLSRVDFECVMKNIIEKL